MDARISPYCMDKAMAWIDICQSTEPCEIFDFIDDKSISLGFNIITIVSINHFIIGNIDYHAYPKINDDTKERIIDEKGRYIYFLVKSSSFRSSYLL